MLNRRHLGLMAAAGLGGALSRPVRAQAWPDRPLRWIVGYAPGGASDIFARIIGKEMSAALGQSIVVENRPSGGAIIATEAVVRSPADGYSLLHVDNGILVYNPALYAKLPFDPDKELTSVGFIGRFPMLVMVRQESPYRDFASLLTDSKTKSLTYSTPAVASPHHLAMEVLKRRSGLQIGHVPYRGTPAALNDMLSGTVDASLVALANAMPLIQSGRARGLLVVGDSRAAAVPEVPCATELGHDAVAYGWQGMSVPAATPPAIVARLNALMIQAIKSPDVAKQLAETGTEPVLRSAAEMQRFVEAENALWRPLIRELGIRLDA